VEALQTHGRYRETWHPPKSDRFVTYERSDESWLRPLGYGSITKTLLPLYDVRLRSNGDLVGYLSQDPVNAIYGRMYFPILTEERFASVFRDETTLVDRPEITSIEMRASQFANDGRRYLSWSVDDSDVPALVRSNLLTHGPDNREQFIYELRSRNAVDARYFTKQY
jgi:hypothetical protein